MNILKINNTIYCFVAPTRTGTRWIHNIFTEAGVTKGNKVFTHQEPEYKEDIVYLMSVRNPFERERSFWRWAKYTASEPVPEFKEWLLNPDIKKSMPYSEEYPNIFKKISKFVHIEKLQEFMLDEFNIVAKDYLGSYHDPADSFTDLEAYSTRDMILYVYEKYKPDIEYLDFIGMDKYVKQI